ncbi:hypothetical protein HJC23_004777 [Cyclotella cryptica]|uniref:Anaphase-promoting complex subunit CDC26 n=1 Tax=Cyclotella cryptica TaxID=29204 RepID=A0ABD3PXS9_9STRA|eukprot:CCRYP_010391-RA/>CCRYP_010391-RA protein AED:0.04 eAED:0.04 QI:340/1/1/1/1/1/2/405/84
MALRRPPTRIELKADDVEEYDKIMRERRILAEQQAMREQPHHGEQTQQAQPSQGTALLGASPSSLMSSHKKTSAAERIGYRRPR